MTIGLPKDVQLSLQERSFSLPSLGGGSEVLFCSVYFRQASLFQGCTCFFFLAVCVLHAFEQ